jgi:transcriptional antiterminator NusG
MCAEGIGPDLESVPEDDDVLAPGAPDAGDGTVKVAETVAGVIETQAEEAIGETDVAETQVEESAEEAEVVETQVEESAEETEAAETQVEESVEEAEVAETQVEESAEEAEVAETQVQEGAEETEAAETQVEESAEEAEVAEEVAETGDEEVVGDAETDARVSESQDGRAWYVIHCYSGYENKVKHNLEQRIETMQMQDQIFEVVVPTEDEMEVRDGKRRVVERRVFPGYILVQMTLTDDSWYVVRNTPGVTGFVGMGNEPTPLRPEEVQAIMKRMEAEAPKIKVTFKQDQKVRIIDGPFNEFIGVVDEIDMERAKVRVLVSFFGRETPVELDFLQVEKT